MDDIFGNKKPGSDKLDSVTPDPLDDPKHTHSGMPPVIEPIKRDSDVSNLKNQHKSTRMGMPKVVPPPEPGGDASKLKNQHKSTTLGLPGVVVPDNLDSINPPPLKKPHTGTTMGMPKVVLPPLDDEDDAVATKVVKNPMALLNEEEKKSDKDNTTEISQTIEQPFVTLD